MKQLKGKFKDIYSVNPDKVKDALHDLKYNTDRKAGNSRSEAEVQAEFIQGMLAGQADYEDIKFVASELALMQGYRFDVVGIKEDTLYIFELKRDRTRKVGQVAEYVELVNANEEYFRKVLSVYPNHAVGDWEKVQGVMVMAHAVNVHKTIGEKAQDIGVEVWYFEPALRFVDKVRKNK